MSAILDWLSFVPKDTGTVSSNSLGYEFLGSAGHLDTYLCLNNLQKVYESYTGIQQDQPEI